MVKLFKKPMEDLKKVEKKRKELGEDWVTTNGFKVLTGFKFLKEKGKGKFFSEKGYPLKAFVNIKTGELRIFAAVLFKKDVKKD